MNLTFIGTGYVGLVSGVMMSYLGHNVTCLDINPHKIAQLERGELPIYEPGLGEYIAGLTHSGRLKFTDKYDETLKSAAAIFLTVGTPSLPSGEVDLSYLLEAIDNLTNFISNEALVIIKSTVPPGTSERINEYLLNKNITALVASNPEFLREGSAVEDFLNPERIVIGVNNPRAESLLKEIYKSFTARDIPLVITDYNSAELIKYASNAFLATRIAFINEMADLCEKIDADIEKVSLGMGLDTRIGARFLKASPGFGGSCFPKDIMALSCLAKEHNSDCLVLEAAIKGNRQRPANMIENISSIIGEKLEGRTFAVLGLTFKADTDDIRSSPAIEIIQLLQNKGAKIVAYDPAGMENASKILLGVKFVSSPLDACSEADAMIITTEWQEFKNLDFAQVKQRLNSPVIIDLRNILSAEILQSGGIKYYSIGRKYRDKNHEN